MNKKKFFFPPIPKPIVQITEKDKGARYAMRNRSSRQGRKGVGGGQRERMSPSPLIATSKADVHVQIERRSGRKLRLARCQTKKSL